MTTAYTEDDVLLTIGSVFKAYNHRLILRDISAVIRDIHVPGQVKGQVVAILGPSGIGKSTLFRILAGLEQPTAGSVTLAGSPLPVKAGQVGVVAQDYPLFAHHTVYANLMLAARIVFNAADARTQVIQYLADFDLADVVRHYPAQLSGGQRQRVAILQQVLAGSNVILMDEPFSGLDPIAKRKTEALIQKIANLDEKTCILVVTHDIEAAVSVADHLWLMGRKRDVQGKRIAGATIVTTYNLIDLDLAWEADLPGNPGFLPFLQKINREFEAL